MNLVRAIVDWVRRAVSPQGLLIASGSSTPPAYEPLNAMSTFARFPWIWVAVQAIATDMSGLAIVAVKTRATNRKRKGRELTDDPALDLLENPNAGTTGFLLVKQLWVDFLLDGNAYLWRPADNPQVLYRLHPADVRVVPGPMGLALAFEWSDPAAKSKRVLPAAEVIHIRDVSWNNDASAAYGESVIRCLHDDLTTELQGKVTAKAQAAKGRPDVLFSVKALAGGGNSKPEEIVRRWETALASRHGAFVVGGEVEATPLSWTPREFDFLDRSDRLRDTTLALFGVPPTRAGLVTASYGGSRQEMRVYWEGLIARGRVFEAALSRLASPGVRLEFDYSAVEALQVSYTERLMRVSTWVGLGASPLAAAEYEQFDDAPVGETVADFHSPRPIDRQPEEPQDKQIASVLAEHFRAAASAYAGLDDGVDRALFVRWQTERLFVDLDRCGVPPVAARWWAEELAVVVDERHRMGLDPLGPKAAEWSASQILLKLSEAA